MTKYTGDAVIGVGLSVQTPKPLDDRSVVTNTQQLYATNPKYAYEGMTVANLDNGNIYMLRDKSKIASPTGWKASYESIQIQTCTEAEYQEWLANTNTDFTPKDESLTYIHQDTYYYIFEESISDPQQYLKASWGASIEEQLATKAPLTGLTSTNKTVEELSNNIQTNYASLEYLSKNYVPISFIEGTEGGLNALLGNYYTKEESDDTFVPKTDLVDDSGYKFVPMDQYTSDSQALQEYQSSVAAELATAIKSDGSGVLDSLTIKQIMSVPDGENQLVVDVKTDGLYISDDKIPTLSELPKHQTITKAEYDALETVDSDTYYYVTDAENTLVMAKELENYYTIAQVESKIVSAINALTAKYDQSIQNLCTTLGLTGTKGEDGIWTFVTSES